MKIIEINCFEVYSSYDRDFTHVGYFATKELADEFNKGKHYNSVQSCKKTYIICESLDEQADMVLEQRKQAALAKLSKEERELLGLA